MSDLDGKIAELQRKIQVELQCKKAGQMMRTQLRDRQAIAQCDQSIHDAQKRIEFLEAEMAKVAMKKQRRDTTSISISPSSSSTTSSSSTVSNSGDSTSTDASPAPQQVPKRLSSLNNLNSSSPSSSPSSSTTNVSQGLSSGDSLSPNASVSSFPSSVTAVIPPPVPAKKRITDLDQRKAEAPISTAKVTLKLHEIAFKLDVEKKVKTATERMNKLYSLDPSMGDKKSRAEVSNKIAESNEKLVLLKRALQRYQGLYIGGDDDDEDDDQEEQTSLTSDPHLPPKKAGDPANPGEEEEEEEGQNAAVPGLSPRRLKVAAARRGVTGTLYLKIGMARQLAHAPARGVFRGATGPETSVAVRVDSESFGRTRVSKQQRWAEEMTIPLERANEIELTLYDRGSGDQEIPVGLTWFKLAELVEELRHQQDQAALNGPPISHHHNRTPSSDPNAPAESSLFQEEAARFRQQQQQSSSSSSSSSSPSSSNAASAIPAQGSNAPSVSVEGWWDVEPVGQIHVQLRYVREGGRRAGKGKGGRATSRLGRQGAVRKRREEVHELHGHRFISQQFYNIVKCALCAEFLLNGSGYSCEDCRFTCHKRCYPKVVTRCVSRVTSSDKDAEPEEDEEEAQLNHRIPHRFEAFTNLSANWCCHCGLMLSLGGAKHRSASRRCSECGLTSHESCSPLVPDFCGMSMEMANKMLSEVRAAKRRTEEREKRAKMQAATAAASPTTSSHPSQLGSGEAYPSLPMPGPSSGDGASPVSPPSSSHHQGMAVTVMPDAVPPPGMTGSKASPMGPPTTSPSSSKTLTNQSLDHFNLIRVLGKGNFGKVLLAEEKATGNLYAIKVLKKEFILQNDEVESTRSEKRVFQAANRERHPFLVGLHSCFQTSTRIYFVMEYVNGGDLMLHIQKQQFSETRAKFYAAEVLLALEYFHRNDIIYRDLKLDNILLAADGHVKIADYGLCKEEMGYGATTNTFCGTPEFMAPEILLEQRYGRAVDWWAFGVLIYEMLLGQSPFHGDDEEEIFDSILEDEVLYPINMSRDSVSILQRLLIKDPPKRLGSGPSDAEEIKAHPFFKDVDWDAMLQKRIPPTFVPAIRSRTDTSNFDEEFTKEPPVLTPLHSRLTQGDQAQFQNFSYVAEWAGEEKGW
ncbi:MAG: hypothetical protein DHS80DRAFT_23465 [Piptocephalis tieghemiana]|nr:MAG: hypothetical protein DHS80DRAFT_23465 [Piptocephalis tieghemiana]